MHLWTDYEGKTVNGDYLLGRLLRSEGRNGFFATTNKQGQQAVIRLTEAHFDEDQQLERWRKVAALKHPHLIEIDQLGSTDFDGVSLTYALMEAEDASLGDVLKDRSLTPTESLQVARAVAQALRALHGAGLVHEHIEAANVLAVGEVVKLRSDCVRECVADQEFLTQEGCAALRRKDVRALGTLLLRCLTLESELRAQLKLPEPFYRVVPGAIDGSLSLEQIEALLGPEEAAKPEPPSPVASENAVTVPPASLPPAHSSPVPASSVLPVSAEEAAPPQFRPRNERRAQAQIESQESQSKRWLLLGACAAVLLLVIAGVWHLASGKPQTQAAAPVQAPSSAPVQSTPAVQPAATPVAPAHGWHVIAYTYNHEDQAQAKVKSVLRHHASLEPQVFSPGGHGPYLVALGGVMSEQDAKTMLQRARRSGMPRDTFIRNY
ncbi:MAG: hypothetical protein PW735_03670 [Acidobacteriaceae bacterium]|nr:hypothetical protein [Acidobacteriaceae bacterium]